MQNNANLLSYAQVVGKLISYIFINIAQIQLTFLNALNVNLFKEISVMKLSSLNQYSIQLIPVLW